MSTLEQFKKTATPDEWKEWELFRASHVTRPIAAPAWIETPYLRSADQ